MNDIVRQKLIEIIESFINKHTAQQLQNMEYQLGIDEAGRGPVFGSMVYSGLWWPIQLSQQLGKLGFCDSKVLTEDKRQNLFLQINFLKGKCLDYQCKQLTPEYISNCMLSQPPINLNIISHSSALQIMKTALSKKKVKKIYVDTVGDPQKYRQYLYNNLKQFKQLEQIVVTTKADSKFKVVSAASICAKVTRDNIIKNWKFVEGLKTNGQLGSGYPGDPATKLWLVKNINPVFGYPDLVRFSWNTTSNALSKDRILKTRTQEQQNTLKSNSWFFNKKLLLHDIRQIIKQ